MIISKCPLRISLAGGSTDLQAHLNKYNEGAVITFTPNLYTYISLKSSSNKYYRIIYSSIDNCLHPDEIKNDIAREVIKYFNLPPVEIIFTSDIPSTGSGLASSSSYLIAMINAALAFTNQKLSIEELAKLALKIEHTFNPLTGYQDIYGCVYSGFKKINFDKEGINSISYYTPDLFEHYNLHLVPTGITRSSTNILSTLDLSKIHSLMGPLKDMDSYLQNDKFKEVCKEINYSWELKKLTSPYIMDTKIANLDVKLSQKTVARRLIGAGAGGYFLCFTYPNQKLKYNSIPINLGEGYNVIEF